VSKHIALLLFVVILTGTACHDGTQVLQPISCPTPTSPRAVLVDATHDGGAWWFPQSGSFAESQPHQGLALAETFRTEGYVVNELGRGEKITRDRLLAYAVVIRAGNFGAHVDSELGAYDAFVACPRTLVLLGEFLAPGERDDLADRLGIALSGNVSGTVTSVVSHPITEGVTPVPFVAGSLVDPGRSVAVQVLGWLDGGQPVLGIQQGRAAKVFFIGDTNGLESVPQPLIDNIVAWGF